MKRLATISILLPTVTVLFMSAGCVRKPEEKDKYVDSKYAEYEDGGSSSGGGGSKRATRKPLVPIENLDGVIKGKVVYEGTPPADVKEPPLIAAIESLDNPADKQCCDVMASPLEKREQTWIVKKVGDEYRVANAVVFLRLVDKRKQYFPVKPERLDAAKVVKLTQPHCAFIPHVVGIFPQYFDAGAKELKPTKDKFLVTNTATIAHNTATSGTLYNQPKNVTIPPGTEDGKEFDFNVDIGPIQAKCSIHPWMGAQVWTFDHPYFAVTDEEGNFEIKDVPTGAEVEVVGWHEATGEFFKEKKKLNKGENMLPLSVKKGS